MKKKSIVIDLTQEETDVLYWFLCGVSLHLGSPHDYSQGISSGTYIISGTNGFTYMSHISESTIISLVDKKAIRPLEMSTKEWKVQIALGTNPKPEFELTALGKRLSASHLSCAEKSKLIKEHEKNVRKLPGIIEKYGKFSDDK